MRKILITGVCSTNLGAMERQLGNMAILIPTIEMLKRDNPNVDISTTMQLSDSFCSKYQIKSLRNKLFWRVGPLGTIQSLMNLSIAILYRIVMFLGVNPKNLILNEKLKEYVNADLVLDFDGDIYSSKEMQWYRHIKQSADLITAKLIAKKVSIFASTLGPFYPKPLLLLAKFTLNKLDMIISRESISSEYLKRIGIKENIVQTTACPAFLLAPTPSIDVKNIFRDEDIDFDGKPLIGIIIPETILTSALGKFDRDEYELYPIKNMIVEILNSYDVNIVLLSHVYGVRSTEPGQIEFTKSPDMRIMEQLYLMTRSLDKNNRIHLVKGFYSPNEIKGLIGHFKIFISGRLHAAVAAWSQCIPTIGIAYSSKFYGFARFVGQEKYLCNKEDILNAFVLVQNVWDNRDNISDELRVRMRSVQKLSELNFQLIKSL